MRHTKPIFFAALAATFPLLIGGIALAESKNMDTDNHQEITEILNTPTSLVQAIGVAEQKTGGKAFRIDANRENGSIFYEIKSIKNGKVFITAVDPTSGKVVKSENEGLLGKSFDGEDSGELGKFAGSSRTLTQMIKVAEKHLGGTAVEAGFEDENENENNGAPPTVTVKVAKGNVVQTVLVDTATNAVMAVRNEED